MAERKSFVINTEPHVAEVGDVEFEFKPEVDSGEFLDAYDQMRRARKEHGLGDRDKGERLSDDDIEKIRKATQDTKVFVAEFMLPESRTRFLGTLNEETGEYEGGTKMPDRVLVALTEWVTELYGARPTGLSKPSATGSSKSGKRSTGSSRSKASTPKRGRSTG